MTSRACTPRRFARHARALAVASLALVYAGCYGDADHYPYHHVPHAPHGTYCEPGIDQSFIDRGPISELWPGEGVGATIEYSGDGYWRIAVTCDLAVNPEAQGYPCEWVVVVGALEGDIEEFWEEALELEDVIEWYPGTQGSLVEDAVRLESFTDYDLDAFTFRTEPGDGIWVSASLDGACGSPFLIWLDAGRDRTTTYEMIELYPEAP